MQSFDLSQYNLAQLKELQTQVADAIVKGERKKFDNARDQIMGIAHSMGLSVAILLRETGLVVNGQAVNPRKPGKKAETKYRNPDKPVEIWTGRGRQPKWVKAFLEANPTKSLNDLEVE